MTTEKELLEKNFNLDKIREMSSYKLGRQDMKKEVLDFIEENKYQNSEYNSEWFILDYKDLTS